MKYDGQLSKIIEHNADSIQRLRSLLYCLMIHSYLGMVLKFNTGHKNRLKDGHRVSPLGVRTAKKDNKGDQPSGEEKTWTNTGGIGPTIWQRTAQDWLTWRWPAEAFAHLRDKRQ